MTIKMLLRKKDSKRQTTILLLFLIVSFNGKALQEIGYSQASFNCEFQREGFARDWLLLGLFQLIVLRTLPPCSAKRWAGGGWGEIISCRNFFFHSNQEKQHPGFHSGLILCSIERISAFVDRLIQSVAQKKESYLQDTTDFVNVIESKNCLKIQSQSLWTLLVSTTTHHTKRA